MTAAVERATENPAEVPTAKADSVMRVAIVGAGPAGIYAADILHKSERDFELAIDLFEQLPAPYGLVRYGLKA